MIVLDATTKSLEIVLGSAVTTTQLPFVASYSDLATLGENDGTTNNTTAVTVVAAPAANLLRRIDFVQIHNADTAAATVTVRYNNNSTTRIVIKVMLAVGSQLIYTDAEGWSVVDANGQILTANAATVTPGGSNTQVQFNDSGAFGGDAGLTYNKTTDALTVAGAVSCAALTATGNIDFAGFDITASTGVITASSTGINNFNGTVGSDRNWKFNNSHASTPYGIQVNYTAAAPNDADHQFFIGVDTGGVKFAAYANGGIANYSANNVNLSDERTKVVLGPVMTQWDRWKGLEFLTYEYKDEPGTRHAGLTAQRTRQIFPELISAFDGELLGIREAELFMLMGRVVQESQTRIEALEKHIATLSARIHQLEPNFEAEGLVTPHFSPAS